MILQRLTEHYDRLLASEKLSVAPGYSLQKISFCLVIELDGTLNSIEDLRTAEGASLQPRRLTVPGQGKPSGSGLNPCLLWDNAQYLLGWSAEPDRLARAGLAFEESRRKHLALEKSVNHPAYAALCAFMGAWSPAHAAEHAEQLATVATHFGVFRIARERKYIHEVVTRMADDAEPGAPEPTAMCLVTGVVAPVARLHEPKIKGVADAQSGGALLVSFNAPAFTSYGKDQSFNAPVSMLAVFKYANALNYLLNLRERRIGLGDATVVSWADHPTPLEDCLSNLFGGSATANDKERESLNREEDIDRVQQARLLLTQLRDGTRRSVLPHDSEKTKFFILGLSPNASRLSVRLWIEAEAGELERRLIRHIRDIALRNDRDDRPLTVRVLVNATGRYDPKAASKFDTKGVSPNLAGELARSILTGAAYPESFLATMVRRIRSDAYVGVERVSAIKACLIRNSRLRGKPLEVSMELDAQQTDIAYRCGRLFALLEKAQTDSADGEINSTIKDKFFSSASATPELVFPRLFRLNHHHLARLETGGKIFYGRQMAAAMEAPFAFPKRLSLSEQGQFIVGYFHQRQNLYTKKDKTAEEIS